MKLLLSYTLALILSATAHAIDLPGYLYPGIKIGTSRAALQNTLPNLTFINNGTSAAILPFDKRTTIFELKNDRVVQISYGWSKSYGYPPFESAALARRILNEFTKNFGLPKNALKDSAAARIFTINPSDIAILQAGDHGVLVTVMSGHRSVAAFDTIPASLASRPPPKPGTRESLRPPRDYFAEPLTLLLPDPS